MSHCLLVDVGSTYTKTIIVDLHEEKSVAQAQAPTTVATDVTLGMRRSLSAAERQLGFTPEYTQKLACSSAAGGLKMVAVGNTPDLTGEAARRAALGAGARVLRTYSRRLSEDLVRELAELNPDIILLSGGTDGGDTSVVLHNAERLATSGLRCPVVFAGNRRAAPEVEALFDGSSPPLAVTQNVLPDGKEFNPAPAREALRQIFLGTIVEAKGLDKLGEFVDRTVMPTPAAVLVAAQLLADGAPGERGLGDLLVVDVGGATTDVHSIALGAPTNPHATTYDSYAEPRIKRTVEGDLGMRVSAKAMLAALGPRRLADRAGTPSTAVADEMTSYCEAVAANVERVPTNPREMELDLAMGRCAVDEAVSRHVGLLRHAQSAFGAVWTVEGKDLSEVETVVGTGGVFAHTTKPAILLREATAGTRTAGPLKPRNPRLLLDQRYMMWAAGLLAEAEPEVALRLMKKHLVSLV